LAALKIPVEIATQATAQIREAWEEMMDNAQQCRAKALLCRQQAYLHPEENWKWLAQAERWEHLAETPFIPGSEPLKPEPRDAAA
jgi:hypothetical protein